MRVNYEKSINRMDSNVCTSFFRQSLQHAIIEHNLIQDMPIPNELLPKYLQHRRFPTAVINSIICPNVLTCAYSCLTDMFQYFYLIQNLIIAFVVIFRHFFIFIIKTEFCLRQLSDILVRFLTDYFLVYGVFTLFILGLFIGHRVLFLKAKSADV